MLVGIIFQSILIRDRYISGIGKSTFIFFISSIVVIIVPGVRSIPTLIFHIPNISSNGEIIAPSFISSELSQVSLEHPVILCFESLILFRLRFSYISGRKAELTLFAALADLFPLVFVLLFVFHR